MRRRPNFCNYWLNQQQARSQALVASSSAASCGAPLARRSPSFEAAHHAETEPPWCPLFCCRVLPRAFRNIAFPALVLKPEVRRSRGQGTDRTRIWRNTRAHTSRLGTPCFGRKGRYHADERHCHDGCCWQQSVAEGGHLTDRRRLSKPSACSTLDWRASSPLLRCACADTWKIASGWRAPSTVCQRHTPALAQRISVGDAANGLNHPCASRSTRRLTPAHGPLVRIQHCAAFRGGAGLSQLQLISFMTNIVCVERDLRATGLWPARRPTPPSP